MHVMSLSASSCSLVQSTLDSDLHFDFHNKYTSQKPTGRVLHGTRERGEERAHNYSRLLHKHNGSQSGSESICLIMFDFDYV